MMNKKEIFRKIGGIISELTEQYQYLSENLDSLNDLELELFTANSKFLTDHAEILRKLNTKSSDTIPQNETAQQQETISTPAADEPAEETPEPLPSEMPDTAAHEIEIEAEEEQEEETEAVPAENHSNTQAEEDFSKEEIRELDHTSNDASHTGPQGQEEELPAGEQHRDETVQEVVIPEKTISVEIPQPEAPSAPRPTLNDLISAQKNQAAAAGVNRPQQIKDLKSAISLNDKLLFIKELFNGYSLAYSEAIEILNRFETFEAADAFLKTNYAEKNNWIAKEPIVDKLYDLLRKRYAM